MTSPAIIGFSEADTAELAEIVHGVVASHAAVAAAQAEQTRFLARAQRLAHKQMIGVSADVRSRDMALRGIAAEIAAAIRSTDRSLQRQIGDASVLADGFPATLDAWADGVITRAHVALITELGLPLPVEVRAEFERLALARCEVETANRLKSELAILAQDLHPRTLTERHVEAREKRCIRTFPLADGMAGLELIAPALHVEAIRDRLTQQANALIDQRRQARERVRSAGPSTDAAGDGDAGAHGDADGGDASGGDAIGGAAFGLVRGDGRGDAEMTPDEILASDDRTIDQLRADILTDMLLTAQPSADPTRTDDGPGVLGAIRAKVQVIVAAHTLRGDDEHAADLAGQYPIDADTARRLAGTATTWDRVLTDPATKCVLATDSRFVTPAMRRFLNARDGHCRFPGCRVPAIRTEIDHTIDHALGGHTCVENCAGLCQRHHSMKQFTAWKVRQLGGGVLEWTSPLGRVYLDHPPTPTVAFVPDRGDPPPF